MSNLHSVAVLSIFNLSILLDVKVKPMEFSLLPACNLDHAHVDSNKYSSTIQLSICLVKLTLPVIASLTLHPFLKLSIRMD